MASNILARRTLSNHLVEMRPHDRNTRDRQTMQRTIIKQGYLKKLPNASRLGSSLKKVERRWFIFGVMGHTDPYLEYYENEDSIFGSRPLNIIFLDTCYKITRDQKTSRFINIFTLVLKERQLSLVAPTRDMMFEWSRAIEDKLSNLGFIESSSHGANDYIRIPAMERRYPEPEQNLPPPERHYLEVRSSGSSFTNVPERDYLEVVRASGINFLTEPFVLDANGQDENTVEREICYGNVATAQHTSSEMMCEDTYDLTFSPKVTGDVSIYMTASPEAENLYMNVTKSATTDCETIDSTTTSSSAVPSAATYDDQLNPESVYLQCTASSEPPFSSSPALPPATLVRAHADTPSASSSNGHRARPVTERPPVQLPSSAVLPSFPDSSEIKMENNRRSVPPFHLPSYDEAMTPPAEDEVLSRYGDSRFANPASRSASTRCLPSPADFDSSGGELSANCASGIADFPAPPPYSSQKVLFKGANLPLKQIQVQKLIEEMGNPQGIQVVIPKNQCQHSIAFTDCFSKIWISGWNQRTCPTFHSFLHIGDQLIAINGVAPNSRLVAKKMLKTCSGKTDATLTIRRIPCGRVVAIRKDNAVESLGVTVVNGTAEVGFVDPTGLARQSGLEEKAPAMTGVAGCGSWWITEINHQPLNLFYKDDEAKHRLNAMGNHISFVVQPTHLIVEMKKQIKNLKGFRDFLVQ